MSTRARLITIPISHYCEKARWALDFHHFPYDEEAHFPGFHFRATFGVGAKRTVPVLVTQDGVFADSTDILTYVDRAASSSSSRLYPEDAAKRKAVEELEDFFDEKYGPHTRRLAYFHVLPQFRRLSGYMARGTPAYEAPIVSVVGPALVFAMKRSLAIDAAGAQRSRQKIEEAFRRVEERLARGTRYLTGDTFTAADLTFAALSTPLTFPAEAGAPLPKMEELPSAFREDLAAYAKRPAFQYAQRLFREERRSR
ncbi:MAG: glutathione S-transferase family protein [Myxococcota bacterium]